MKRQQSISRAEAQALAQLTEGAYSFDRYGSWQACATMLLRMGFDQRQAEAILRSKITRWAADASASNRYGRATALDLQRYINAHGWKPGSPFIRELVEGTFGLGPSGEPRKQRSKVLDQGGDAGAEPVTTKLLAKLQALVEDARFAGHATTLGFDLDEVLQHYEKKWGPR